MTTKQVILCAIGLVALVGAFFAYREYNRKVKDLTTQKAEFSLEAQTLIQAFESNEAIANARYLDKIIEVKGNVKSVEKNDKGYYTVIIGDSNNMSSVRCSMDSLYNNDASALEGGATITMKGACTGFNADELLGSDVILNRCVVAK